jgi:hypothetical protein
MAHHILSGEIGWFICESYEGPRSTGRLAARRVSALYKTNQPGTSTLDYKLAVPGNK